MLRRRDTDEDVLLPPVCRTKPARLHELHFERPQAAQPWRRVHMTEKLPPKYKTTTARKACIDALLCCSTARLRRGAVRRQTNVEKPRCPHINPTVPPQRSALLCVPALLCQPWDGDSPSRELICASSGDVGSRPRWLSPFTRAGLGHQPGRQTTMQLFEHEPPRPQAMCTQGAAHSSTRRSFGATSKRANNMQEAPNAKGETVCEWGWRPMDRVSVWPNHTVTEK